MSFNYGKEERKWKLWKEAEEKKLRKLGVSENAIDKLYSYDKEAFNSDRRFHRRLQDVGTYLDEVAEMEQPFETKTVEELLDNIENKRLYQVLINVDKLTLKIVVLKMQGYSTHEIADFFAITEKSVYRRMDRLKKKIKKIIE